MIDNERDLIENGMRIFDSKAKRSLEVRFEGMNDEEVLCYVMCRCVGWSTNRLSKVFRRHKRTIIKKISNANSVLKGEKCEKEQ